MVGNKRINTISSLKKRIKAILIILENDDKVTTTMLTAAKKILSNKQFNIAKKYNMMNHILADFKKKRKADPKKYPILIKEAKSKIARLEKSAKKDASLRKEAKEFRKELNKLIKSFKS